MTLGRGKNGEYAACLKY